MHFFSSSFSLSSQVQDAAHYLPTNFPFQTLWLSLVEQQPGDNNAGTGNAIKVKSFAAHLLVHLMTACGSYYNRISLQTSYAAFIG